MPIKLLLLLSIKNYPAKSRGETQNVADEAVCRENQGIFRKIERDICFIIQ